MNYEHLAKRLYRFLKNKKIFFSNLKNIKDVVAMPTYNSECKHKSIREMKKENIAWLKNFHELNVFYKMYGLDVVGSDASNFIDYKTFMETRNVANKVGKIDSQTVLLRDKYLFFRFMRSCGLPVPDVFAVIKGGKLFDVNLNEMEWSSLKNDKDYFIKDIDGECASFVKHINCFEDLIQICEKKQSGCYILQRKLIQCKEMNEINSGAINTLRIATINKDGDVYVLTSLLRIGTSKTGNVDNWAAGGIAVGIQPNGFLKEYGYYKPSYGTRTSEHPDSRIVLNQFKIPQYEEALRLACKAHKFFYNIRAIGWDVAISETGPMFIEGNDNWEISLQQVCDRPLKKDWMNAIL